MVVSVICDALVLASRGISVGIDGVSLLDEREHEEGGADPRIGQGQFNDSIFLVGDPYICYYTRHDDLFLAYSTDGGTEVFVVSKRSLLRFS